MSKKVRPTLEHYLQQYICVYNKFLNLKKNKSARSDWPSDQKVNKCADWSKTFILVAHGHQRCGVTVTPLMKCSNLECKRETLDYRS